LAAAGEKLIHMDQIATRQQSVVHLGMPGFSRTSARTVRPPEHLRQDGSTNKKP
jgi:hypothetical protein